MVWYLTQESGTRVHPSVLTSYTARPGAHQNDFKQLPVTRTACCVGSRCTVWPTKTATCRFCICLSHSKNCLNFYTTLIKRKQELHPVLLTGPNIMEISVNKATLLTILSQYGLLCNWVQKSLFKLCCTCSLNSFLTLWSLFSCSDLLKLISWLQCWFYSDCRQNSLSRNTDGQQIPTVRNTQPWLGLSMIMKWDRKLTDMSWL